MENLDSDYGIARDNVGMISANPESGTGNKDKQESKEMIVRWA